MTSPELSGTDWFSLTTLQSGMVVSLSLAGALVGSVAALVWGDKLGRRKELLLASAFYAAGSGAVFAAPSLSVVLIGRAL
jgi:predicted MFS family arabinose efflux permease